MCPISPSWSDPVGEGKPDGVERKGGKLRRRRRAGQKGWSISRVVIHPERAASVTPHVSLHVTVTLWGGASAALTGGNELQRKIDRRNRWMHGLFLAWPHFRDPQKAQWVCLMRPREREQTKPYIIINHPHVT